MIVVRIDYLQIDILISPTNPSLKLLIEILRISCSIMMLPHVVMSNRFRIRFVMIVINWETICYQYNDACHLLTLLLNLKIRVSFVKNENSIYSRVVELTGT